MFLVKRWSPSRHLSFSREILTLFLLAQTDAGAGALQFSANSTSFSARIGPFHSFGKSDADFQTSVSRPASNCCPKAFIGTVEPLAGAYDPGCLLSPGAQALFPRPGSPPEVAAITSWEFAGISVWSNFTVCSPPARVEEIGTRLCPNLARAEY